MRQANLVFPAAPLELATSPRSVVLLIGKWHLDAKVWVAGVLAAPGVSLLVVPLRE